MISMEGSFDPETIDLSVVISVQHLDCHKEADHTRSDHSYTLGTLYVIYVIAGDPL